MGAAVHCDAAAACSILKLSYRGAVVTSQGLPPPPSQDLLGCRHLAGLETTPHSLESCLEGHAFGVPGGGRGLPPGCLPALRALSLYAVDDEGPLPPEVSALTQLTRLQVEGPAVKVETIEEWREDHAETLHLGDEYDSDDLEEEAWKAIWRPMPQSLSPALASACPACGSSACSAAACARCPSLWQVRLLGSCRPGEGWRQRGSACWMQRHAGAPCGVAHAGQIRPPALPSSLPSTCSMPPCPLLPAHTGLPELHTLRLNGNVFHSLRGMRKPAFFPGLPGPLCSSLRRLEMRGCFLRGVPPQLSHLTALTALDLSGSRKLEIQRSDVDVFSRLTNLRELVRGWGGTDRRRVDQQAGVTCHTNACCRKGWWAACVCCGALGRQQHVAHTRAATGQATLQGTAGKLWECFSKGMAHWPHSPSLLPPSPACSAWPSRSALFAGGPSGRRRRWRRCWRCSAPAAGWMRPAVWSWRGERWRRKDGRRGDGEARDQRGRNQRGRDQTSRDRLMTTGQTETAQRRWPGGHAPCGQCDAQPRLAHSAGH